MSQAHSHRWVFSRMGGFDQVLFQNKDDLLHLAELDQKLWAALSCPVKGLQFDEHTLDLIDTDQDGRVRAREVIAAVEWACKVLSDPGLLLQPASSLPLSAFNEQTAEGANLLASAQEILSALNKVDATEISLSDTTDQAVIFSHTRFNGDGVVPAGVTDDPQLQQLIVDILASQGEVKDASGEPGVDTEHLIRFFEELTARQEWLAAGTRDNLPLGDASAEGFVALQGVRAKVDDFFSRGRLAQYDARSIELLNKPVSTIERLGADNLSASLTETHDLPLALLNPENHLPLVTGINPAWESALHHFRQSVVIPLLGEQQFLTFEQWNDIKARFEAYAQWRAAERGTSLAGLSVERMESILANSNRAALEDLIAQDLALAPQVKAFSEVAKILVYRQHLKRLLNNFVNFTEFYGAIGQAIFQVGTLYLDGRACELCVRVDDPARHAVLAGLSKCFLAYCDLTRHGGEKMSVVAAFTAGDSDYLLVGRNGVFYDRQGRDWDATITKLIENPISISQAFFAPYKRFTRFVETQAAKGATAADMASGTLLEHTVTPEEAAAAAAAKPGVAPPPPPKPKFDLGTVAALGVAVGGITTAIGLILQSFFGMGWLMPLGLLGILLLISGPSMFLAWLKLRQRNLGPILDATGWAINGHIKINIPFGGKLTQEAKLPVGASRTLIDPYQEKPVRWGRWSLLGILVAVLALCCFIKVHYQHWPWEFLMPKAEVTSKVEAPKTEAPKVEAPAVAPAVAPKS